MAKRALLVGCLYTGTKNQLRGCYNDTVSVKNILETYYGFAPDDIIVMTDADPQYEYPSGANIKRKLAELVAASRPGDALVFHYSGHGVQVPSDFLSGDEADRKDEALCPADMNVITDDDLRTICKDLDPEVHFTMIADCCHSGTLLDHDQVVISGPKSGDLPMPPQLLDTFLALVGRGDEVEAVKRAMPPNDYLEVLAEKLGVPVQPGGIRAAMAEAFGDDVSAKFQGLVQKVGDKVVAVQQAVQQARDESETQDKGLGQLLGAMALQVAEVALSAAAESAGVPSGALPRPGGKPPPDERLPDGVGLLVTGCQDDETSADACPPGRPEGAYGVLTNAMTTVIKEFKAANPDANISTRTLVSTVRDHLAAARFAQNPCLEGSEDNADKPFILGA